MAAEKQRENNCMMGDDNDSAQVMNSMPNYSSAYEDDRSAYRLLYPQEPRSSQATRKAYLNQKLYQEVIPDLVPSAPPKDEKNSSFKKQPQVDNNRLMVPPQ